jgi:hypothetical protein
MDKLYHTDKFGRFNGKTSFPALNPKFVEKDIMAVDKDGKEKETGEIFIKKSVDGEKYLYDPRKASLEKPPECGENESAVLTTVEDDKGTSFEWIKVVDRLKQSYYAPDGYKRYINSLDIDVPKGCITNPPPSEFHTTHDGTKWIEDLDKKKTAEDLEKTGFAGADIKQMIEQVNILFKESNTVASLKSSCKAILIKIIEEVYKRG